MWVEIKRMFDKNCFSSSLPARGVWVEIQATSKTAYTDAGHSPRGECGLKFPGAGEQELNNWSLPARGVWVEIFDLISL